MLFFRIYHLSAKKHIGIWKIALCTQSLQLPQLLESQSFILNFRPDFMVKTKEKMAFFLLDVKKYHVSVIFFMSYCFVMRIFAAIIGLRP